MRKIIMGVLLGVLGFTLEAGQYFSKLGKYNNVRVISVSHRGIQISHQDGICYITDNGLTGVEANRLKKELRIYKSKLAAYQKNQLQAGEAALEKLQSLERQLPKMSKPEIEAWLKKEVQKDIFAEGFKEDFKAKFKIANADDFDVDTAAEMLTKIFQRLLQIAEEEVSAADCDQLQKKLNKLSENISRMKQQDIEIWAEEELGKKISNPAFRNEFVKKFQAADYRRKLQQAMQEDNLWADNSSENSSDVLDKLINKLTSLHEAEVTKLKNQCVGKKNSEINDIIEKHIGVSAEDEKFIDKFNKKFFLATNCNDVAQLIKMEVNGNIAVENRKATARPDWMDRNGSYSRDSSDSVRYININNPAVMENIGTGGREFRIVSTPFQPIGGIMGPDYVRMGGR